MIGLGRILGALDALRRMIFGETWSLPVGVAIAIVATLLARSLSGEHSWWHTGGGFLLAGLVAVAVVASALARRDG